MVKRRRRRTCSICTAATAAVASAVRKTDSQSYETDEVRPKRKKCYCPIFASVLPTNARFRRNTERFTWEEARLVAAAWEVGQSGEDVPAAPAEEQIKKYSNPTRRLNEFSEHKGYTSLPRCTTPDAREFRDSWSVAPRTTAKHLSVIKAR